MIDYFSYIERIELNPTEICNLKCSFCPRGHGYPNTNVHMSQDTCQEIRRQLDLVEYTKFVSITGRGEPTLTENFEGILDIILKNNPRYKTYMYTNGKNLEKYEDYIHLFWKVYVDIYQVDTDYYHHECNKWSSYKNVQVLHKPDLGVSYSKHNELLKSKFSNRGGFLNGDVPTTTHPCAFIFQKMFINWNGDYNLCCDDWQDQIVMSNIHDMNIKDYINKNKKLQDYRKQHIMSMRSKLRVCANCTRIHKLHPGIENKLRNHK